MGKDVVKGLVNKEKTTVTVEELKKRYPSRARNITEDIVKLINDTNNDPNFNGNEFLNSLFTYESVMFNNSAGLKEYINAVKFVGYLMSEEDNYTEAYMKARCNDEFVKKAVGKDANSDEYKAVVAAASRYRKNKLVVDLLTQVQVPWDIMYAHAAHGAFRVLTNEMVNAPLSRDRINAAKTVLENVKPNDMKIELEAGPGVTSMGETLSKQLLEVSAMQKKLLESGQDISSVQRLGVSLEDGDVQDAEVVNGE